MIWKAPARDARAASRLLQTLENAPFIYLYKFARVRKTHASDVREKGNARVRVSR
nr:MAG TPA: hypothetical protein [Caudoviricetes sp.]